MITETLNSVLSRTKERQRLEAYDREKMQLLYKNVLEDTGLADLQHLINVLNEKARLEIEEEEKKQKRKQATVSEAGN